MFETQWPEGLTHLHCPESSEEQDYLVYQQNTVAEQIYRHR